MAFKAQAYIGLAWLDDVGTFDNEKAAQTALDDELAKQLNTTPENEREAVEEAFWANSQITPIKE